MKIVFVIYMWGNEFIISKRISYYCYFFFIIYIDIMSSIIYFIFVYQKNIKFKDVFIYVIRLYVLVVCNL